MQLGIHVVDFAWPGAPASIPATLTEIAEAAEEAGCQRLSVMDHYFQMDTFFDAHDPMLEAYTTLGFLAARTQRLQLHVLATGVTYRHPGLLAKIVATVDVLSVGRAELAIGAAWYEREHHGLGVPFPPLAERFERLEETLRICLQMWSDDEGPFDGKHYRLAETICSPAPITRPHPPVMIGGGGERKTLRLVARYADASNMYASSPEEVGRKLDVLRRHCDDAGRDYDEIGKAILHVTGWPDGEGFLDDMARYSAIGIDSVVVMPQGPSPAAAVAALGKELIPRLAEL